MGDLSASAWSSSPCPTRWKSEHTAFQSGVSAVPSQHCKAQELLNMFQQVFHNLNLHFSAIKTTSQYSLMDMASVLSRAGKLYQLLPHLLLHSHWFLPVGETGRSLLRLNWKNGYSTATCHNYMPFLLNHLKSHSPQKVITIYSNSPLAHALNKHFNLKSE